MKINWGARIALLYIGFVVLIITLVTGTMRKKTDLVSDDYYHQETIFQQRLNATTAGDQLHDPLKIKVLNKQVIIDFPKTFKGHFLDGNIHFYAPSDAGADYTYALKSQETSVSIDCKHLKNVPYEVQVNWAVSGKDYYQSVPLKIQ